MTCRYGFIGGVIQSSDLLSGHVQYSSQRMYKKIYLSKPYGCKMSKNKTVPSFFVDVSLERRNKNTISVFNLTLGQIEGFVTFVWVYPPTLTHAKVRGIFPLFNYYFPPVLEFTIRVTAVKKKSWLTVQVIPVSDVDTIIRTCSFVALILPQMINSETQTIILKYLLQL